MAILKNSVVSMLFQIKDADSGEILEDNTNTRPIEFILGKGHILESLENEIEKLDLDVKTDILIKKEMAFGDYNNELIQELPKEQFAGLELFVGMELFGESEDGQTARVIVKEIKDDLVVIDYNHPYSGKDLLFNVNIIGVRDATEAELSTGMVAGSCGCEEHDKDSGCCGGGCSCC